MSKQKQALLILIIIIIFLFGGSLIYKSLSEDYNPNNESTLTDDETINNDVSKSKSDTSKSNKYFSAPDFTVIDSKGNNVSLSDFLGSPIILNFWATWCGPCRTEMPYFDKLYKEYGNEIEFLMVNLTDGQRDTVKSAKDFVDKENLSFPVYFDTDHSAALAYYVHSIPVTYAIDEDGYIVKQSIGIITENTLKAMIDTIK